MNTGAAGLDKHNARVTVSNVATTGGRSVAAVDTVQKEGLFDEVECET